MQEDERRFLGPPEPILVDGVPEASDLVFTTAEGKPSGTR